MRKIVKPFRTAASMLVMASAAFAADGPAVNSAAAAAITPESVLEEINRERAGAGLDPLRDDFRLRLAAEDRMRDMVELAYWSHESPDGLSPFAWVRLHGYQHASLGENLASGFETAGVLVESWMESKGHRANILEPQFRDAGIAVLEGATTRRAAGNSVVILFGRETIAAPISRRGSSDRSPEPSEADHR